MAFGAEEVGLIGSKYYVEHPLFPLSKIKFLINLDIVGTGDEGITVVNATEHKKEFEQLLKINEEKKLFPQIKPRGKFANSDHYFFSEKGVKSFFIYTMGGIKAYHDIYDKPQTLPLTKFEELYHLLLQFTDYLQN
jgi:Zn-dependent M28 family amino/carboxypeptidase